MRVVNMIKLAICDDERFFVEKLHKKLSEIINNKQINVDIEVFYDGEDLLNRSLDYDIYVLDIEMENSNGLKVAEQINALSTRKPIIIFVTNYDNYVYESFELEVFRFLRKDRIDILLERYIIAAIEKHNSLKPKYYNIFKRNTSVNLSFDDISYIEKDGKNILFHTNSNITYSERNSLREVIKSLDNRFIFIDRCYIVNIAEICSINNSMAILKDGRQLSISRSRLNEVKRLISEYWRSKI